MILKLKEIKEGQVITNGNKELYNADKKRAGIWNRKEIKGRKTFDAPNVSSAVKIKQKGRGKIINNALGYTDNHNNNVYHNNSGVLITSSCFSEGHGFSIIPENFRKVVSLFTARKTIIPTWINCKDEYLIPNL